MCRLIPFLVAAVMATLCPAADLVLRGGKIVTVDPEFRVVEAMAVEDGRIVQLGTDAEIDSYVDAHTRVVELGGRMVLPGLIDSHVHPTGASQYEADHEIPSMETIDDVLRYVRERAAVVPKGEWIELQQVFITRLREQRFPTRQELDSVAPEHPVWFRTGPDGSANSLALAENEIDKAFAAEHPDQIAVDPTTGELTGVIRQSATVFKTRRDKSQKRLSQDELDDRLVELIDDYSRWGITGIIDRNCSDEPIHLEQSLSRQQMIRFYTINNAWLMRAEDEVGSLEVGKRADFVVIDRDLLTCSDDDIRDTIALSTWLDGKPVLESPH